MERSELRLLLSTAEAVQQAFEQNLRLGRAFVAHDAARATPAVLSECDLVLCFGTRELRMQAQVVMVSESGDDAGIGLALMPFDADVQAQLEAFVQAALDGGRSGEGAADADGLPEADAELEADAGDAPRTSRPPSDRQAGQARHAQLRRLSVSQQQKVARTGDLSDRVAVERLYGKSVWAALLQNPKLTVPEVAKIARKGTVPRPLIDVILENKSWLKAAPIRRALMSNPRTSSEGIMKILRMTPKHELKMIHKGTSYAAHIREQARKLLG